VKKAFLETNAINRFLNEKTSGNEIRAVLSSYGYEPVIGTHTIYELARTFLSGNDDETARNLFEIIRDLKPEISEKSAIVLRQEYATYVGGPAVSGFMRGNRKAETRAEIVKLANGTFDDEARSFVTTRDENFKRDHPVIGQTNRAIFLENPPDKKLHSFEDVLKYYQPSIPVFVEQILTATPAHATDMAERISEYPLLRSTVLANLYLVFVAVVHKDVPATDKIDDHRHVIDASYCDVFVTEEKQLLSNVKKINPDLKPVQWSTMGKIIDLSEF